MSEATLDPTQLRRWKSYPNYVSFESETISRLPEHWRDRRLKFATRINPEVLSETTDPDYEIEYVDIGNVDSTGRIIEKQQMRFENAPSRARRVVRHGDVIISTVRTYLRAIAAIENPPTNLVTSTGFAVLRANGDCDPRYLSKLIQSNEFVDMVVNHSEGVGYPAINPSELANLPIWLPPLPEQRAIAAFLDRETARIDTLIEKKQRLIDLLEEKRQAVISHAVTRGLNPDAKMKDSGIEWIGETPSHWQVHKGRWIGELVSSRACTEVEGVDGLPFFKVDDLNNDADCLDLRIAAATAQPDSPVASCGELLLFPKRGAAIFTNKARIVRDPILFDSNLMAWSIYPHNEIRFIAYALLTRGLSDLADVASVPQINNKHIYPALFAVPPKQEQVEIVAYIERIRTQMSRVVRRICDGIRKLQDYRTALISAAVTGQIDVRDEVQVT